MPGGPGRGSDAHRRLVSLLRREQRIEREIQALEQLLRSLPDDPRVPRGAREAALARRGLRRFIARRRERARVRMQIRELTEAEDEAPSRRAG